MRKFVYVLAVALVALAATSCNIFTEIGNAECAAANNVGCATGGVPAGFGCQGLPGQNLWACNLDSSLVPPPTGLFTYTPAPCGVTFCALDAAHAVQQAAALAGVSAADPRLSCLSLGTTISSAFHDVAQADATFNAPGAVCVGGACNPCSDGQGGTLQSVGQYCNTGEGMAPVPGGSQCCAGLTCTSIDTESGICQGTLAQCPKAQPNWQPLDTGTLRNICVNTNINGAGSQSGVTLNRTCGVAFETWVLKTMGWLPRWNKLIDSPQRQMKTGGLPGSVIPEQVLDQSSFMTWVEFPKSLFVEVKAVNGTLTLGTSQWQILGLLNVAQIAPPPDAGPHAPPAVFFITTSNTTISTTAIPPQVVPTATGWGVAVWQQIVYYDANGGTNPNLSVGDPTSTKASPGCLNDSVYGGVTYTIWPGPGPQNPLTWATIQEQDAVGAVPDPDSPAMVP